MMQLLLLFKVCFSREEKEAFQAQKYLSHAKTFPYRLLWRLIKKVDNLS